MLTTFTTSVIGVIGLAVTGGFGWLTARISARSQREQADVAARGPDWDKFTEHLRAELDKQTLRVDALADEINDLKTELTGLKGLYRSLMDYAKTLFSTHPAPPPPPSSFKADFPGPEKGVNRG